MLVIREITILRPKIWWYCRVRLMWRRWEIIFVTFSRLSHKLPQQITEMQKLGNPDSAALYQLHSTVILNDCYIASQTMIILYKVKLCNTLQQSYALSHLQLHLSSTSQEWSWHSNRLCCASGKGRKLRRDVHILLFSVLPTSPKQAVAFAPSSLKLISPLFLSPQLFSSRSDNLSRVIGFCPNLTQQLVMESMLFISIGDIDWRKYPDLIL